MAVHPSRLEGENYPCQGSRVGTFVEALAWHEVGRRRVRVGERCCVVGGLVVGEEVEKVVVPILVAFGRDLEGVVVGGFEWAEEGCLRVSRVEVALVGKMDRRRSQVEVEDGRVEMHCVHVLLLDAFPAPVQSSAVASVDQQAFEIVAF